MPFFPINYLSVKVIYESLWTGTDNPDQPILNKQLIALCSHFSFVTRVTVEYKCDWSNENGKG